MRRQRTTRPWSPVGCLSLDPANERSAMKTFNEDGLSFSYPNNWSLERERGDEGWTVTLQSPGAAFAVVRLDRNMPTIEDTIQTTLEALQADYPTLEAEPAIATLAGEMAVGH